MGSSKVAGRLNIGYSDHASLFFDLGHNYSVTPVLVGFLCTAKYTKMMFISVWNRTNSFVTAWRPASNLNAANGSIPIKRLNSTHSLTNPIKRSKNIALDSKPISLQTHLCFIQYIMPASPCVMAKQLQFRRSFSTVAVLLLCNKQMHQSSGGLQLSDSAAAGTRPSASAPTAPEAQSAAADGMAAPTVSEAVSTVSVASGGSQGTAVEWDADDENVASSASETSLEERKERCFVIVIFYKVHICRTMSKSVK